MRLKLDAAFLTAVVGGIAMLGCAAQHQPESQEQQDQSLEGRRTVSVARDTRTRLAPTAATPNPFTFRIEPGAVGAALQILYDLNQYPTKTSAEASAAWARRAQAEATVTANAVEARGIVLANLRTLDANDDDGFRALALLVDVTGSDALIQSHLRALLLEPPPAPVRGHNVDDSRMFVRQTALGLIVGAAQKGDRAAKNLLLELVGSPDVAIQRQAVRAYYALSADRRLAQRSMRRLMAPSQYYLLYEY